MNVSKKFQVQKSHRSSYIHGLKKESLHLFLKISDYPKILFKQKQLKNQVSFFLDIQCLFLQLSSGIYLRARKLRKLERNYRLL